MRAKIRELLEDVEFAEIDDIDEIIEKLEYKEIEKKTARKGTSSLSTNPPTRLSGSRPKENSQCASFCARQSPLSRCF